MSLLNILKFPDSRLRTVAKPVDNITGATKKLIEDMFETMYEAEGIGLAATQVNVHKRIIVIDIDKSDKNPIILINPILEILDESISPTEEGCLSVPNYYENVKRANEIKVSALNELGQPFEIDADEMLSICIQHEMDHLKGILFVDHLSKLKQKRLRKKAEKQSKKL